METIIYGNTYISPPFFLVLSGASTLLIKILQVEEDAEHVPSLGIGAQGIYARELMNTLDTFITQHSRDKTDT